MILAVPRSSPKNPLHIFVISPAVILLEKGKGFSGRVLPITD